MNFHTFVFLLVIPVVLGIPEVTDCDVVARLKNADKDQLVVVVFGTTWCSGCKRIVPKLDSYAEAYGHVIFLKVDAQACEAVADGYGVESYPTFIYFRNGKVLRTVPSSDEGELEKHLEAYAPKPEKPATSDAPKQVQSGDVVCDGDVCRRVTTIDTPSSNGKTNTESKPPSPTGSRRTLFETINCSGCETIKIPLDSFASVKVIGGTKRTSYQEPQRRSTRRRNQNRAVSYSYLTSPICTPLPEWYSVHCEEVEWPTPMYSTHRHIQYAPYGNNWNSEPYYPSNHWGGPMLAGY